MPGDSTKIFYVNPAGDTIYLSGPDTVHASGPGTVYLQTPDSTYAIAQIPGNNARVQVSPETEKLFGNLTLIFLGLVLFSTLVLPHLVKWIILLINRRKAKALIDNKHEGYHQILLQYLPYYKNLPVTLQRRFMRRTVVFMTTKKFEYIELVEEDRMPLLVSAAAIQLTFGLKNYLMDHFEKIYILHHDYHFGPNSVPFQGHVTSEGIYLSWNNFLRGYDNYSDGDNVGLHEMAHALAFVNFNVDEGSDDGFRERFIRFSKTGRAYFYQIQNEANGGFLGSYAASRYEEFWAVCVENFFERPTSFKIQMPELYTAMCELLNQDVLSPKLFLSSAKYA